MHAAIVGAGLAGLACANRLAEGGATVTVFDKARGPGGRLATRRLDNGQADLGAQYFTARDPIFGDRVARWEREGIIARWRPLLVTLRAGRATAVADATERWVGTPRMSALTRHLATGLDLCTEQGATAIAAARNRWRVITRDRSHGPFDRVVLAMPAPQAAALLRATAPGPAAQIAGRRMRGCWAAALAVDGPGPGFDAAFADDDAVLRWLAHDGTKPGRPADGTWVVHATADWSDRWLEADPAAVLPRLIEAFRAVAAPAGGVHGLVAHRWRYARGPDEPGPDFHLDERQGLAACGDWCRESRVESAWLSGHRLAEALLNASPARPHGGTSS